MNCLEAEELMDLLERGGLGVATADERVHLGECGACAERWAVAAAASEVLAERPARRRARPSRFASVAAAAVIVMSAGYALWRAQAPSTVVDAPAQEVDAKDVARLIDALDSAEPDARAKAETDLLRLGAPVEAHLQAALKTAGAEQKARLQYLLQRLSAIAFGTIAYTRLVMAENADGSSEVETVSVIQDLIIRDLAPGHSPGWSPDGAAIVYVSTQDGNPEIYVIDGEGKNRKRLTKHRGRDLMPRWSPDGKKIAFATDRDGNYEIYVMDADGANARPITSNAVADYAPDWSPDGKSIVFVSARDGNDEIYVMDSSGENPRRLTRCPVFDTAPRWSPDGKRIVFLSTRAGGETSGINTDFNLYVMDGDGRNPEQLTDDDTAGAPAWSADGRQIVFPQARQGDEDLMRMDADGENAKPIAAETHAQIGGFLITSTLGWRLSGLEGWYGAPSVVKARQ